MLPTNGCGGIKEITQILDKDGNICMPAVIMLVQVIQIVVMIIKVVIFTFKEIL